MNAEAAKLLLEEAEGDLAAWRTAERSLERERDKLAAELLRVRRECWRRQCYRDALAALTEAEPPPTPSERDY